MSSSDTVKPEATINGPTNQFITDSICNDAESLLVKKELFLNYTLDGNVDKLNKSNKSSSEGAETPIIDSSRSSDDVDNRVSIIESNPNGSPTLAINAKQTVSSEHATCTATVIKTEPIDQDGSNSKDCLHVRAGNKPSIKLVAGYQSQDDTDEDESMDTNSTAEKKKDVEFIKEVKKEASQVIDVKSSSETSDSSSDSSDSESSSSDSSSLSSSSGEDSEAEEQTQQRGKSDGKKGPQDRKEATAMPEQLPTVVYRELVLPEDVVLTELGYVNSIIGQLVVIQSHQKIPALNMDSVLFKGNREAIGAVYDVFGPVVSPLYSVVFNSAADITTQNITLKMPVFFAPNIKDITAYVFTDKLRHERGSDASWKNDEEPPPECLEYSDDEKEKEAKHKKQEGKDGRRRKKPQRRGNQESRGENESERGHHHQRGHRRQWSRNGLPHSDIQNQGRQQFESNNGQFGDNAFHNNQGHQPMPMPPFGQMGYQFPPRTPPPGHQHPPPLLTHPLLHPKDIYFHPDHLDIWETAHH
ncbi:uncharacterized protein [Amphiura filiformis]|uniref:uncharacterized protein n=1 Tax=Amphiura filiformis TaxID=82378 RepID=UPI003B21E6DE